MRFEGEDVDDFQIVLRQWKGQIDVAMAHGEYVMLEIVAKVSEVSHVVNERSGTLSRVHVVHVKDLKVVEDL